jgi:hypothetical protein
MNRTPKSFFKALFISTHRRVALRRMGHSKAIPDRLNLQECNRNAGQSKPPIPYIPEKDIIQEAPDTSANTLKLTLPHKGELPVLVWPQGTPRQLLVHIQQALNAIRQAWATVPFDWILVHPKSAPSLVHGEKYSYLRLLMVIAGLPIFFRQRFKSLW